MPTLAEKGLANTDLDSLSAEVRKILAMHWLVYTGIVQRSLKGSETYSYVKPCFNCLCIGGETSHTSADYKMSRSSDSWVWGLVR